MKRFKSMAFLALAATLLPGAADAAKKWEKIKSPQLRDVAVPEVQRQTMSNGLELFVLEDHELPLFRMTLVIPGGTAHNPKSKLGLADVTAEVLRSGGSTNLSGDDLDELLESRGGSIEVNAGRKTTTITVNVLVEDTRRALEIVRDLLLQPAYPQDKIDLALTQLRSAISRRNDDPQAIADREFDKILYGPDHPFAQQIEYEHLDNIHRDDLLRFHRQYFHPTNAYLALWGDFDTAKVLADVQELLGAWPRAEMNLPPIPAIPETKPSVNLVVKESVTQSNIRLGHRSITMKDPDYYPLVVMNEILGGGLGSRLFNEVRSKLGLAYRVGSGLGAGLAEPGMFRVVCGTKSETTVKAIRACIAEVERMKSGPVEPDELKRAKDGLLNSHVFRFANKGAIVNRQMRYVRNGYPADFVEKFAAEIQKVTAEDVHRAAQRFLHPDNFALLVVGKPDDFDEDLSALGEVNTIDISIPEPKAAEYPEPTPETLARGGEIMTQAAKAMGGEKAFGDVRNLTAHANLTLSMMGQSIPAKATRYMRYPGQMRMEINVMGQQMVQVFNGEAGTGFMQSPQGRKDFGADEIDEARETLALDLVNFLARPSDYKPQYIEDSEVDGNKTHVVLMTPPGGGKKFKVYVDAASKRVVKLEHPGKNFQGAPVHQEVFFSDFRKVGKVLMPFASKILQDGELFMELENTGISVTDDIPDDKFAKSE